MFIFNKHSFKLSDKQQMTNTQPQRDVPASIYCLQQCSAEKRLPVDLSLDAAICPPVY